MWLADREYQVLLHKQLKGGTFVRLYPSVQINLNCRAVTVNIGQSLEAYKQPHKMLVIPSWSIVTSRQFLLASLKANHLLLCFVTGHQSRQDVHMQAEGFIRSWCETIQLQLSQTDPVSSPVYTRGPYDSLCKINIWQLVCMAWSQTSVPRTTLCIDEWNFLVHAWCTHLAADSHDVLQKAREYLIGWKGALEYYSLP